MAFILGVVGAGVSALGTIEQGQATANAANYQAEVANNDAVIAQQNATYAEKAGAAQTQQESMKNAAVAGSIKAGLAANGVDVNTGSASDVELSQRETGQLDTETTNNNALLTAYGYRTQATNFTAQAGLYQSEAEQAPIGADIGAAGGLLGNASSIGFKWNQANNPTASTTYPTIASDQGGAPSFSGYGGS